MMSLPSPEGFVYASFAESYMDEAFTSIGTLLQHSPGAKVCLLTAETLRPYYKRRYAQVPIDQVRYVPYPPEEPSCFFRTKLCELSPYHKTIALDADTYIAADIQPLFDLLDTFDFVAVPDESHPARGFILGLQGGYAALNYYNCGFLMFRKSPAAQQLFDNWRQEYLALAPLEPADQGPLVRALVKTHVRFITLPREYNLRLFSKCASFHGRAKVIHARAKDPHKLIKMVNDIELISHGSRVWMPHLQRVISAQAFRRYGQWLHVWNLDNVQLPAAGHVARRTLLQHVAHLGRKLLGRLASAGRRLAPPRDVTTKHAASSFPETLFAHLLAQYPIRSVFVCAADGASLANYCADRAMHVWTLSQRPPAIQRVDLVWAGGIRETISHQRAKELITMMTGCAGRFLAFYLIPAAPLPPPGPHPDASLHLDWYWTQLVSEQGLYFDPYLTLAWRRASSHEGFQRTGLVFERLGSRSPVPSEDACVSAA